MLLPMFGAGLAFLIAAVVAGLYGFGVVSEDAPLAGKLFSGFFLCASAAAFWWGWMMRWRQPVARRPGADPSPRAARSQ